MWPSLIKKAKEGGLDIIETYVFWNAHEPHYRQSKMKDLKPCFVLVHIGFPVWLHNIPGIEFRTNNAQFEHEMKNFTTLIIENEYGNIMSSYGDDGKQYVDWCSNLAQSYQIGIPWVMCQQDDAPDPMLNSCNGFYCDQFYPNSKNKPKMWTENWTGWFKNWGGQIPHRTAEDVAFAVARFFQYGGTYQNYYMYHGGTNFGRTSEAHISLLHMTMMLLWMNMVLYLQNRYLNQLLTKAIGLDSITRNLNQPKWGHLKKLHEVLKSIEDVLVHGHRRDVEYGNMVTATIYSHGGKSACFLGNANNSYDASINFQNNQYNVPAWSVSILPDCYKEAYSTAKVNVQTSVMVMKENEGADNDDGSYNLKWEWRHEPFEQMKNGKILGNVALSAPQLLDQKVITNGTSDYLWYITSVNVDDNIWTKKDVKLRINTNGHVLHAFVNGKHAGSQYAKNGQYQFSFETNVTLKAGTNEISLLSATVGLPNYGAFFDNVEVGVGGPIHLVTHDESGDEVVKNITNNMWNYKVGLHGENVKHYEKNSLGWLKTGLPTDRIFTWYKFRLRSVVAVPSVFSRGSSVCVLSWYSSPLVDQEEKVDRKCRPSEFSEGMWPTNRGKGPGDAVHDWLMQVLRRIPMDGTFAFTKLRWNQHKPLDRLNFTLKG
ncbi:hypothetical protein Ahy_A04g021513 [Arachis hypogaea]|uniref:beta-galactosidase n=1 Tax=Arachis hypogaea TaxID=3818 RepID=A0A445DKN3_ARAHY|nr:hypothetical protein Ahy_A04g021513 [Arachis hypogaea]